MLTGDKKTSNQVKDSISLGLEHIGAEKMIAMCVPLACWGQDRVWESGKLHFPIFLSFLFQVWEEPSLKLLYLTEECLPPCKKKKMPLFLDLSPNFIIQGSWDDRKKGKWRHIKEASPTDSSPLSSSRSRVTPLSPLGPINFPKSHCRSLTVAPAPTFFFPTKKAFSPSQLSFCELPEQMDSLITVYVFFC